MAMSRTYVPHSEEKVYSERWSKILIPTLTSRASQLRSTYQPGKPNLTLSSTSTHLLRVSSASARDHSLDPASAPTDCAAMPVAGSHLKIGQVHAMPMRLGNLDSIAEVIVNQHRYYPREVKFRNVLDCIVS